MIKLNYFSIFGSVSEAVFGLGKMGNTYDLSIRNILIFVLYSVVLIIMFGLLARRQIKRMRLRYDKNFETRAVKSFPKSYRYLLQKPTQILKNAKIKVLI